MNPITVEDVRLAYRKLKSLVFYDKTDLRLRLRLAEFECDPKVDERLAKVAQSLNSELEDDPLFSSWLEQVRTRVLPKGIEKPDDRAGKRGRFISNVTSSETYDVDKLNYFFDGPIEIHLIAVLWITKEGFRLDKALGPECYGSRLDPVLGEAGDGSTRLFLKYHELYSRWRDSGIRKAKELLTNEGQSVYVLGLDLQQYYYHVRLNFTEVAAGTGARKDERMSPLLRRLEAVHRAYHNVILPELRKSHPGIAQQDSTLPIGLCSSPILANWHLRDFDAAIKERLRPAFYGRYVDDIFIVVPGDQPDSKDPVAAVIGKLLVDSRILQKSDGGRYEVTTPPGLYLQQEKCILQFFDAKHSIAGLEKFKKKLEENASDFLLLPTDEGTEGLADVAYDLMYDGSINKFRSIKGVGENRYELAKHLAKQAMLHLLTESSPDSKASEELLRFFKGRNAIAFHDSWERAFTFLKAAGDSVAARMLSRQIKSEIARLRFRQETGITSRLIRGLRTHLRLSRAMADALGRFTPASNKRALATRKFREANLIRHQFVRLPLLNYTDYPGSLLSHNVKSPAAIDPRLIHESPRHIHFDECLLAAQCGTIDTGETAPFEWAKEIFRTANRYSVDGLEWRPADKGE